MEPLSVTCSLSGAPGMRSRGTADFRMLMDTRGGGIRGSMQQTANQAQPGKLSTPRAAMHLSQRMAMVHSRLPGKAVQQARLTTGSQIT